MTTAKPQHPMSYKTLLIILFILLVLTTITVAMSYVDLGFFNVHIALAIATAKVTLVLLYFMHLKFEGAMIKYSFISTILFLAIMISFTFWDVAFR
jgi:cytochrome c oxidase subunit IV